MKKALLVIDCQNEYYAAGGFPLWNMDGTVTNIKAAMKKAKEKGIPIILAQHVFPKDSGMPAFIDGTPGDDIADEILKTSLMAVEMIKSSQNNLDKMKKTSKKHFIKRKEFYYVKRNKLQCTKGNQTN